MSLYEQLRKAFIQGSKITVTLLDGSKVVDAIVIETKIEYTPDQSYTFTFFSSVDRREATIHLENIKEISE